MFGKTQNFDSFWKPKSQSRISSIAGYSSACTEAKKDNREESERPAFDKYVEHFHTEMFSEQTGNSRPATTKNSTQVRRKKQYLDSEINKT